MLPAAARCSAPRAPRLVDPPEQEVHGASTHAPSLLSRPHSTPSAEAANPEQALQWYAPTGTTSPALMIEEDMRKAGGGEVIQ